MPLFKLNQTEGHRRQYSPGTEQPKHLGHFLNRAPVHPTPGGCQTHARHELVVLCSLLHSCNEASPFLPLRFILHLHSNLCFAMGPWSKYPRWNSALSIRFFSIRQVRYAFAASSQARPSPRLLLTHCMYANMKVLQAPSWSRGKLPLSGADATERDAGVAMMQDCH